MAGFPDAGNDGPVSRGQLRIYLGAAPGVGKTVPDEAVRRADQVELADITPEALRRRMLQAAV